MAEFFFDSKDVQNFLTPKIWFVGVHYGGNDSQLQKFINHSIWKNGWFDTDEGVDNARVDLYKERTRDIAKGDILVAKRLNGKGADTMTVLALGIVVGRRARDTIQVAWTLPHINLITPLKEVGTISAFCTLEDLSFSPPLAARVVKARTKFLRLNLSIDKRLYF